MEGVGLRDLSVSLLHVLHQVDDLAEHLVEGGDRIVGRGRAHLGNDTAIVGPTEVPTSFVMKIVPAGVK